MLLKEEYANAEKFLKTAAEAGLEVAGRNLEELTKKKVNAIEIENKKRDK